jgi:peptide/nickel transport system permease protein
VVVTHLLPNAIAPVVVASTLGVGGNIVGAAGLAFLGLGTNDPAQPDWGTMLAEGENMLQSAPQLLLFPGLAILITVLGFNLLGEGLRDALDTKGSRPWRPRARIAGARYARQR